MKQRIGGYERREEKRRKEEREKGEGRRVDYAAACYGALCCLVLCVSLFVCLFLRLLVYFVLLCCHALCCLVPWTICLLLEAFDLPQRFHVFSARRYIKHFFADLKPYFVCKRDVA